MVLYILEVQFSESANDGLELVICSYVPIEVVSILEDIVTESATDNLELFYKNKDWNFHSRQI